MLELAVLVAVDLALLGGAIILRNPKLLLPIVVLGLPIEYFATVTLDTFGDGGIRGAVRALFVPGKAAMLAVIVVVIVRERHNPMKLIPDSAIALPVIALLAVTFIGVAWSDSLTPTNSVMILPMYAAFAFTAPTLIENRKDVERIFGAMFVAAMALACIAVVQRFGVFNWRGILIQSDEVSYRSNATFGDPNILARYFAITIPLAVALVLATGPRRLTLYLAAPTIGIAALGIVASASRSGWLTLALVGLLVVVFCPVRRSLKAELAAAAFLLLGGALGLLLFNGGADAERVRTLTRVTEVIGQREFLIRAGWAMWRDNPFVGVGSGSYQNALQTSYLDQIPTWARTTLSHTSLVSVLAEMGIVGAGLFILVMLRVGIAVTRTYFLTTDLYNRLVVGWLGAALLGIVIHSQSEGRLIDEPYIWLLLAIFIAFETRFALPAKAPLTVPERVAEAVPAMATARARPAVQPLPSPAGALTRSPGANPSGS